MTSFPMERLFHPDTQAALPSIIQRLKQEGGESWAVGAALEHLVGQGTGCCHEPHRVFLGDGNLIQINHDGTAEPIESNMREVKTEDG